MRRFTVTALVVMVFSLARCSPGPAAPPNILFIYVDDLGWRDLAVMGSEYYETPNIDRLASEGILLSNAYANAPNCAPSRASLLTGQYTPRHGVYTVGSAARGDAGLRRLVPVENRTALSPDVVTLAESLRAAGYTTGYAGKWHLGGEGHLPADQGFDWSVAGNELGSTPSHFFPYADAQRSLPGLETGKDGEYLADRLTDEAIRFITANADRPFFLFLSHYSVHTPISARPDLVEHYRSRPGSGGHDNPAYAAMIRNLDEGIGRLLAVLDSTGLSDETVVFFHSDNGGFGPVTSMAPLRGSKGMLYEGGIRVPLIVRWPGHIEPGSRSATPVIGTDFYPTMLEIAGARAPGGQVLDGLSLVPLLEGRADLPTRPLFWHFPAYLEADASTIGPFRTTPVSAVRLGNYKLIWFFEDSRTELYDLERDLSESRDLSREMPGRAAELGAMLQAWWEETGAFLPIVESSN